MPAPPAPGPAQVSAEAAPRRRSAVSASYRQVWAFFERRRETYEELAAAAAPYVDPEGTILDIGANVGYFTKSLGEAVGFRGTAHLFEPIPHLARLCRITASELPFRAPVHMFGLSDEDTSVPLYVGNGNFGWNTMVAQRRTADMREIRVQMRRLDTVDLEQVPSFVKIDVEGAEYRVLRGMLPVLEQWPTKPAILCEIGWGTAHPEWQQELAAFDRLFALGYRATSLAGEPLDVRTLSRTTDVLFVPDTAPGVSGA